MRSIALAVAAFVATAPAAAQGWEEYSYSDYTVAVAFPANPQIEQATFEIVSGRSVPARVYSLRQNNLIFKLTVAELEGTKLEESAVIDHAIRALSQAATVKLNIPARHLPGLRSSAHGRGGGRQPVDGSAVRLQCATVPDRGQGTYRPELQ